MTDSLLPYYPSGVKEHLAQLPSGLKMRFYEKGEGSTLLCLHGFPELSVSWKHQLERLSDGFHVVAPDLRGYGGTSAPKPVSEYTMAKLRQDVIELIDTLGKKRVHLVGHDWGAAIAWDVAQHHGDRLWSLSACNCPPASIFVKGLRETQQLKRSWYVFFFQLPWLVEAAARKNPEALLLKSFRGAAAPQNRKLFSLRALEPYIGQLRQRGVPGVRYYRAAFRGLAHSFLRKESRSKALSMKPIRVPTQLIWGMQDTTLGSQFCSESLYAPAVRDFRVVRIPHSGHWVQQEAPNEVNQALTEHCLRAENAVARLTASLN